MRSLFFFSLLLACCQGAGASAGKHNANNVWSYEDASGVSHFSNIPDSGKYRLFLKQPAEYRLKAGTASYRARGLPMSVSRVPGELPFADLVASAARDQRLDPALLHAIIHVESRHNPDAVSPKGAVGLMQVLPETAKRMGVSSYRTPEGNIAAGARYLRFLLDTFGMDVNLALAAYNAGENAVIRNGNRIPPYRETEAYVPAVIDRYQQLRQNTKL